MKQKALTKNTIEAPFHYNQTSRTFAKKCRLNEAPALSSAGTNDILENYINAMAKISVFDFKNKN